MLDLFNLTAQKIDNDLNNYSMNLFGEDGSGKTSFMFELRSRLGSTAIFGFEDRFKGVPNIVVAEMKNWETAQKYNSQLKKGIKQHGRLPFSNIIMDTVGEAYQMCQSSIMEENDWETMSGERGARYPVVGKAFMDYVRELKHMGFVVNFVSHDKDKTEEDAKVEEYSKSVPDTANQIKHLVMGGIDIIAYLQVIVEIDEDGETKEFRRLWLKNNATKKLKVPLYGFPDYIDYTTVSEGVDKFIEAFNKAVKITQTMADKGQDVSSPNADNAKEVIVEEPKTKIEVAEVEELDDEEFYDDEDNESEIDIDTLRDDAIKVRNAMLEKGMEKSEVAKIIKETIGFVSFAKCDDADKIIKFIQDNS